MIHLDMKTSGGTDNNSYEKCKSKPATPDKSTHHRLHLPLCHSTILTRRLLFYRTHF